MTRPANILWLIKGLGLGGAEKLLTTAMPHLDRAQWHYQVGYFLPWKNALASELAAGGLDVHCFDVRRVADVGAVFRLAQFLREEKIDLVHAHLPHPGLVARLAGRLAGVPVVYTEHNVWGRLHPAMRWLNRATFAMNARAIAVSKDVARSVPGNPDNLVVIDNGIDCAGLAVTPDDSQAVRQEFSIPSDDLLITKVANLTPKKNHANLLHAFALLLRHHPQAMLLLIGQPFDQLPTLQQLAAQLSISGRVRFAGSRTDVPRIVRACDLFVLSSDFEGLPVAMLEAMALQKPVVATAVGGIPDVIRDGVEGWLVPPGDAQALAGRLLLMANDPGGRKTMGLRARRRVEDHYDIARMVRQVEGVYRETLGTLS